MPFTSRYIVANRSLQEVYHLWTLAGGDVVAELKKHNLIKSTPPVCSMPKYVFIACFKLFTKNDQFVNFNESYRIYLQKIGFLCYVICFSTLK